MIARRTGSQVVERRGVPEDAAKTALVAAEGANLEMRGPRSHRRCDAELISRAEAESWVVVGVAEQGDEWFLECVSSPEHRMHERRAYSSPLHGRGHCQRPQCQHRTIIDPAAGAHDVSQDFCLVRFRDHRELRQPRRAHAQGVHQSDLDGLVLWRRWIPKGLGQDGSDGGVVSGAVAANQHVLYVRALQVQRANPGNGPPTPAGRCRRRAALRAVASPR